MKITGVETPHADGGWRPWTFWPSGCGMSFRCTGRSGMDVSSSRKSPSLSIRSAKREKKSAGTPAPSGAAATAADWLAVA